MGESPPGWLVDAFEGLRTSPVGQWSLSAWVHWYEPRRREWFFWGVEVVDAHFLVVHLETLDLPYSGDSLVFLLHAGGADDVSEPILLPLP